MSTDSSIQRAVESGERNAEGFVLVKNWCAHVRIERMGGGGMIEAATGLPIGHHGLACDHAPAGGMMCWDTRDAALYFYDRNCNGCTLRKPVGIPNLGSWVAERDAQVAEQQALDEAVARQTAAGLTTRQADRAALKSGLSPAAADVIDQIEELDLQRSEELAKRLIATARLAPDAFPAAVVEYVFGLLEARESWFDRAALEILSLLAADPGRLARCAMVCLSRWSATRAAARVLVSRLDVADGRQVSAVLPTLIRLAAPSREPFSERQRPLRAPLVLFNASFPQEVATALDDLLSRGPEDVSLAACALTVLARRDASLVARFSRDLISKLVRAAWMPDPEDYEQGAPETAAHDLREAILEAFLRAPDAVDALLQSFRAGASEAGEARIFSVYGRALHLGQFRGVRALSDADRLAFRRLIWEAPKTTSDKVLREIQQVIHREPRELIDLASEEIDHLIGAAILMDARVVQFDAEKKLANSTPLDALERNNRRAMLTGLRNSFVGWAAAGAAAAGKPSAYLDVLAGLPEDRDEFAACMIEKSVALAETAVGLNSILPSLYSGLVGASSRRRGSTARAVGKLPWRQRDNVPELLFEAFVTTLTDPYVYVHRSAVTALDRFRLPESFDVRVRVALWHLLQSYATSTDGEDFVLKCVGLLAGRYLTDAQRAGQPGAWMVSLLARMPSWRVSNDIRWTARDLARASGLVDLLVATLLDPEAPDYAQENVLEALSDLPADVVLANRATLAGVTVGPDPASRFRVFDLIEILSRCGAWSEAEQLSATALAAIPDTVRDASFRLRLELAHVAAAFENAQAQGDTERATRLATRWREVKAAQEANDHAIAQRPDPLRDIPRANRGG